MRQLHPRVGSQLDECIKPFGKAVILVLLRAKLGLNFSSVFPCWLMKTLSNGFGWKKAGREEALEALTVFEIESLLVDL